MYKQNTDSLPLKKTTYTFTEMKDNKNMGGTIAGSMNDGTVKPV